MTTTVTLMAQGAPMPAPTATPPAPAAPAEPGRTAWEALALAMSKLPTLEKRGSNKENKSTYIQQGELLRAARKVLSDEGLAVHIQPGDPLFTERTYKDAKRVVIRVMVRFEMVHGASNTRCAEGTWPGEAFDAGPLSIPSAISSAKRHYLISQLLADGDDDRDDPEREGIVEEIKELAESLKMPKTASLAFLLTKHGFKGAYVSDAPTDALRALLTALKDHPDQVRAAVKPPEKSASAPGTKAAPAGTGKVTA